MRQNKDDTFKDAKIHIYASHTFFLGQLLEDILQQSEKENEEIERHGGGTLH